MPPMPPTLEADNPDRTWEAIGANDPYHGVLTHERFRKAALTEDSLAEFFATGQAHIDAVVRTVERQFQRELRPRRALDFGCGVGRLTLPLAGISGEVVGVDVSASMLEEARRNSEAHGLRNVRFVPGDDALSGLTGRFDFLHTYIVFQHIPWNRGRKLFEGLLDRLEDGGIGVVHVLYRRRTNPLRRAFHWARKHVPGAAALVERLGPRAARARFMQMNAYPLSDLFEVLQDHSCGGVWVEFSNHGSATTDNLGVMLFFTKTPGQAW